MTAKKNHTRLGAFVVLAIALLAGLAISLGGGNTFRKKVTVETYFNESVQGLDVGSKLKYRGVAIGEVTRIGFTYNKYQLDRPMGQRARLVLVEAQIEPRLLGGRAAAGDLTHDSAQQEIERGLRMRLAPQGITGTSYLEIDYSDPPPPVLTIDWKPANVYIPSTTSAVSTFFNSAIELLVKLNGLDLDATLANVNRLMVTTSARIDAINTKAISERAERVLARVETTLDGIAAKKLSDEAVALLAEMRESNAELKKTLANPAWQKLPDDASAAAARLRELVSDPKLAKSVANLERSLGRVDRILGGGEADLAVTIENLRQITDNLRELTEDAKRYPANVILGEPPKPTERAR